VAFLSGIFVLFSCFITVIDIHFTPDFSLVIVMSVASSKLILLIESSCLFW